MDPGRITAGLPTMTRRRRRRGSVTESGLTLRVSVIPLLAIHRNESRKRLSTSGPSRGTSSSTSRREIKSVTLLNACSAPSRKSESQYVGSVTVRPNVRRPIKFAMPRRIESTMPPSSGYAVEKRRPACHGKRSAISLGSGTFSRGEFSSSGVDAADADAVAFGRGECASSGDGQPGFFPGMSLFWPPTEYRITWPLDETDVCGVMHVGNDFRGNTWPFDETNKFVETEWRAFRISGESEESVRTRWRARMSGRWRGCTAAPRTSARIILVSVCFCGVVYLCAAIQCVVCVRKCTCVCVRNSCVKMMWYTAKNHQPGRIKRWVFLGNSPCTLR
eukprot:Opistho-2@93821